jgi:hypothetical protein
MMAAGVPWGGMFWAGGSGSRARFAYRHGPGLRSRCCQSRAGRTRGQAKDAATAWRRWSRRADSDADLPVANRRQEGSGIVHRRPQKHAQRLAQRRIFCLSLRTRPAFVLICGRRRWNGLTRCTSLLPRRIAYGLRRQYTLVTAVRQAG